MAGEYLYLALAKVVVLVLGSAIAALALLAYRRNGERLMLYLGIGFGSIAFGSFVEGVLFEVLQWDLEVVHTVESAFVLAGLGVVALLLRPRWSRT